MKILLFLSDFRSLVKNTSFTSGVHNHSVLFYETPKEIHFYKPIESILYYIILVKQNIPNSIKIDELKSEFNAYEVPAEIMPSKPVELIFTNKEVQQ